MTIQSRLKKIENITVAQDAKLPFYIITCGWGKSGINEEECIKNYELKHNITIDPESERVILINYGTKK